MSDGGASLDELEHTDAPPAPPSPPARRWLDRARAARLVALGGVLVVVLAGKSLVLPHVPAARDVELQLGAPEEIVGLDVRWSAPGSDEDITTTSLRFSPGHAPETIRADVRLPEGAYDVAITVERVSRVDSTRRRISFGDASRVTIPLR